MQASGIRYKGADSHGLAKFARPVPHPGTHNKHTTNWRKNHALQTITGVYDAARAGDQCLKLGYPNYLVADGNAGTHYSSVDQKVYLTAGDDYTFYK